MGTSVDESVTDAKLLFPSSVAAIPLSSAFVGVTGLEFSFEMLIKTTFDLVTWFINGVRAFQVIEKNQGALTLSKKY